MFSRYFFRGPKELDGGESMCLWVVFRVLVLWYGVAEGSLWLATKWSGFQDIF